MSNLWSVCSTASKLINLWGKTHWVARLDALELFLDLYPAVIRTLAVIAGIPVNYFNWNSFQ